VGKVVSSMGMCSLCWLPSTNVLPLIFPHHLFSFMGLIALSAYLLSASFIVSEHAAPKTARLRSCLHSFNIAATAAFFAVPLFCLCVSALLVFPGFMLLASMCVSYRSSSLP